MTVNEVISNFMQNAKEKLGNDVSAVAKAVTYISELMRSDAGPRGIRPSMTEVLSSSDAGILFPRAVSDVLLRSREPMMIGQTLLAKTVQVDKVRSISIPALGAIRAADIPELATYPEQYPSFVQHASEIKLVKSGTMVKISDEVIEGSQWDIMGIMLEQAGRALARWKEEKIFREFSTYGHAVYDNSSTNPALWTNGRAFDQSRNYSVTFDDMIDLLAAVVAHKYVPTDLVVHPMMWAVFAKDPVIRNIAYHQGQIGQSVWTNKPDFNQQAIIPWGVTYNVSPFTAFTSNSTLSTGPASGLAACDYGDIYCIDRNAAMLILQGMPPGIEEFRDPMIDAQSMKIRETYGLGVLDGGRAVAVIKNARVAQNWAPHQTVLSVTPS